MTNAYAGTLDARARALGVRFVAYVEPGSYVIADNAIRLGAGYPADMSSPVLETEFPGARNSFRFTTPEPAVVWSFESGDYPGIFTRLRERDRDNQGLILPYRSILIGVDSGSIAICAGLFYGDPLNWLGVATNKVEVEIIAYHPGVEFFVRPPGM
jgi:hypothetical protein